MILLAIEQSSARGSIALLDDHRVLAEASWNEREAPGLYLFRAIEALLKDTSLGLDAVETFAAGRGPGSYTGLRMAVTAAQAFALPRGKTAYTVGSGDALALETAGAEGVARVAVVGDARRDTLWLGAFEVANGLARPLLPWTLVRPGELGRHLPEGAVLVSPQWARLGPALQEHTGGARCIAEDRYPSARAVGRLACARRARGLASDPMTPIYMHPAVAKAPPAK